MRRLLVILCLVFLLMPIGTARAAPLGWIIIPDVAMYSPIGYAPIINREYIMPSGGVVHLEGTTWVNDDWGRVVLAGHNPGMFAGLPDLTVGAQIVIVADGIVHDYRMTDRHITSDDTGWLMPTKTPTLTLITCLDRGETWLIINAREIY